MTATMMMMMLKLNLSHRSVQKMVVERNLEFSWNGITGRDLPIMHVSIILSIIVA